MNFNSNKLLLMLGISPALISSSLAHFPLSLLILLGRSESFHGCGMQNGFYDHTGRYVLIQEGGGWDAGGRANPAPFWMSSKGYGALRNTYKPGSYNFSKTAPLSCENFPFPNRMRSSWMINHLKRPLRVGFEETNQILYTAFSVLFLVLFR